MSIVIYHNPRCTKSKQTLELLRKKDIQVHVVDYIKNVPSKENFQMIIEDYMWQKEKEYLDNHLNDESLSANALISMMIKYPCLIERPIVINGKKVAIGRPPENVLRVI